MKILRIIARLNVGGPARHVVWLTNALQDEEFSTALIAGTVPAGEENMGYFAEQHGVSPVFIEEMSRELSVKDIVSLAKVYQAIKREHPDIIHTHTAKAGTVGRAAAFLYRWFTPGTLIGKPRKVQVVHTFHGHVFHSYYGKAKTRIFILIEKALGRFATNKIITITPQQFSEIYTDVGIGRREQFEVIPLGIDLTPFEDTEAKRAAFRAEVGAQADDLLITFVGRLTEIKNIPLLLNAAKIYLDDPSVSRSQFLIVGNGHMRAELETLAARLGIAENVLFLGSRDDIDAVYAGIDIVALTSLNEGTPLSLIEAMAGGKPVIATTVGGVVDLLGDPVETLVGFSVCERGISVPSRSVEGFANGLIYLAKNERLRFGLGEKGREFSRVNYSKERLIEDIKNLYRSLMQR